MAGRAHGEATVAGLVQTTKDGFHHDLYDLTTTTLPSRRVVLASKSSRDSVKSQSRPRTAPSQTKNARNANSPPSFEPPIPKIAIFADTFSLKKLREQYQTIRKSPTLPDLSRTPDSQRRPQPQRATSVAASSSANKAVDTSPRLPELNFDSKSASRRPPASRSSHGIETSFGPPPSIVTRSSYSSDIARRTQSPAAATFAQQKHKPYNLKSPTGETFRSASNPFERDHLSDIPSPPVSPGFLDSKHSLDAMMMDRSSKYSDGQGYMDDSASKYTGGLSPGQGAISGADTEGSGQSTEDLFLSMAQDSPAPLRQHDNQNTLERRLSSRGKNNPQRTSLPLSSTSKSRRDSIGSHDSGFGRSAVQSTEPSYAGMRRASTTNTTPLNHNLFPRNPSSLPADQRFNSYRNRYMNSTTPLNSNRRPSAPDTGSMYTRPPSYRPSRLNYSSTRDFDTSSNAESPLDHRSFNLRPGSRGDIAESVVSMAPSAAPSTVWDELHELKSRIQRMEMVDKGSNASGERPKTATTTLTTMSSSPKHPFKTGRSPQDSVIGGPAAINAYPVLHQTLARCKDLLNPALYRSLETATSDALEMALLTGNGITSPGSMFGGTSSVVNSGGLSIERQLRRKADNVVRNLQDLCIALCDAKAERPGTSASRPGTSSGLRDSVQPLPPPQPNRDSGVRAASRAASNEPSEGNSDLSRAVPSRALDRIEARRASLMTIGSGSAANSPHGAPTESVQRNSLQLPISVESTPSQVVSKLPRAGTSLLRMRRRENTEEPEEDATLRAPSRAATDVGSLRKRHNRLSGSFLGAGQRSSREYTSKEPLPGSSPVTSTPPANTASRRLNGTSLKNESPRTPSLSSSLLLREPRRMMDKEKTPEPENASTAEDDAGGNRRLLRRSLGMYTTRAGASLNLGLGRSKGERRSIAATTE